MNVLSKAERLKVAEADVVRLHDELFTVGSPGYGKEDTYQRFNEARRKRRTIEEEPDR